MSDSDNEQIHHMEKAAERSSPPNRLISWRFLSRDPLRAREERSVADNVSRPVRKTKRQRFLEIGEKRTQAVLDRLRLLGNCGNTATYEYGENEVERIFSTIEDELRRTRARFETKHHRRFKLQS